MLTASGDQSIALWETGTAEKLACFKGHSGSVKAVAPMPDTQAVFASGAQLSRLALGCRLAGGTAVSKGGMG
jgi:WD40 repeat protein